MQRQDGSSPTFITRARTRLQQALTAVRRVWYVRFWGMEIGHGCRISGSANLDRTNPRGVHIGDNTLVSFQATILSHDFVSGLHKDTYVGSNCFLGARALIMPGIRVGNNCIIGAGAVVTKDVPSNCVAVGNPARILESNVVTGRWGIRNPKFLKQEAARVAA